MKPIFDTEQLDGLRINDTLFALVVLWLLTRNVGIAVRPAEVPEVPEVAEVPEVPEVPEVAEVPQLAEVAEVAQLAEVVEVAYVAAPNNNGLLNSVEAFLNRKGHTAKEILAKLVTTNPTITKTDINKCLYSLQREARATVTLPLKGSPIWKRVTA